MAEGNIVVPPNVSGGTPVRTVTVTETVAGAATTEHQPVGTTADLTGALWGPFVNGFAPVIRPVDYYADNGQTYLAGSGQLAGSITNIYARMVLHNPSASGKTLHIFKLDLYTTSAGFGELLIAPPNALFTAAPTAARPVNNVYIGNSNAAVATLDADTSATAITGGVDSGVAIGLAANTLTTYLGDTPDILLPAGFSLGINANIGTSAAISANIFWFEL